MTPLQPFAPFYGSAFSWNFAVGMSQVLIPLYAHELGMSGVMIGSLVSLPVLVQIAVTLVGGAITDRIGTKRTLLGSTLFAMVSGLVFAGSASFAGLFSAQILMIVSRATFWPPNWTLASQLPGDRSQIIGQLNAYTNAGQVAGIAITGMVITHFGFRPGFLLMATSGCIAFVCSLLIPTGVARTGSHRPLFAAYRSLVRVRAIYFAIACAFLSALPFSLSVSFYPILLVEQGFSSSAAGWLLSLRAVGSIGAGFAAWRLVRGESDRTTAFASAALSAASIGLMPIFSDPLWAGFLLTAIGVGSGLMSLYFQVLIGAISSDEQRGSAMALGGLGWGLSHLSAPMLVGSIKDAFDTGTAFYVLGAITLLLSIALLPMHAWAMGKGAARAERHPGGKIHG